MITVGIVSPGAMGAAVGRVLGTGGARVVATVEGRSVRTRQLAEGIELLGTLQAVAVRLANPGIAAVDGSISGPPPRKAGTTTIYLSGPDAARVANVDAPGLELRVVGETIGTASAIKMSTASFCMGQTALFPPALRAARANGVIELGDLRRNDPDFVDDAPRLLQSIAGKSGRYVAEMEEIAASQEQVGLTPDLFSAFAGLYRVMSESDLAAGAPEDADPGLPLGTLLEHLG